VTTMISNKYILRDCIATLKWTCDSTQDCGVHLSTGSGFKWRTTNVQSSQTADDHDDNAMLVQLLRTAAEGYTS